MHTDHDHSPTPPSGNPQPNRALKSAAVMVALIGAFFLLREHWWHVGGYWPYLLLLACPLLHVFHGHGGHGHHHGQNSGSDRSTDKVN